MSNRVKGSMGTLRVWRMGVNSMGNEAVFCPDYWWHCHNFPSVVSFLVALSKESSNEWISACFLKIWSWNTIIGDCDFSALILNWLPINMRMCQIDFWDFALQPDISCNASSSGYQVNFDMVIQLESIRNIWTYTI